MTSFQIPKGYEDFVTSAEDLLSQFQHGEETEEFVTIRIFDASLPSEKSHNSATINHYKRLLESVCSFIESNSRDYLWQKDSLHLFVSLDNNRPIHIAGTCRYGQSVEDEWFTTYLLQSLSIKHPMLAIQIHDDDGDFLLIEACDEIDDDYEPQNSENRVWMYRGAVHLIPLDAPGRISSTGGVYLAAALDFLKNFTQDCVLSKRFQSIINARTTSVYPARTLALQHHQVCILPELIAQVISKYPQVVAQCVQTFYSVDQAKLSATVSASPAFQHIRNDCKLVTAKVTFSRPLYAQLTFKKFKVPRKLHGLMRRVSTAASVKANKAFDIGCRITCGLLLAYDSYLNQYATVSKDKDKQQEAVRQTLAKHNLPVTASTEHVVLASDEDALFKANDALQVIRFVDNTKSIIGQRKEVQAMDESPTLSIQQDDDEDFLVEDKAMLQAMVNNTITSDSEDWLYLDPQQLDEEMKQRMQRFSEVISHQQEQDFQTTTKDATNNRKTTVEAKTAPITLDQGEALQKTDKAEAEELQSIATHFRKFLDEKSDYDGIKVNTRDTSNKVHVSSDNKVDMALQGLEELDMSYIEAKLAEASLSPETTNTNANVSVSFNVMGDNTSVTEGVHGTAKYCMTSNSNSAEEVEGDDSDDEIAEDSGSDDADSDDVSDGHGFEGDGYDSDDHGEDFDDYQAMMDKEILGEESLAATFAEMRAFMKERGAANGDDNDSEDGEGADMNDEEAADMHLLMNLLQGHAEGLGVPNGPAASILSQLGISLPKPPPMK